MSSSNLSNQGAAMGSDLFDVITQQDQVKGDVLAKNQKLLFDLKREISLSSKNNFTLDRDVKIIDKKIALLVKNRISLEDVLQSGEALDLNSKTTTIKDKSKREFYGQLFYLLQNNTHYIAQLAKLVKVGEIDNLLQCVMFTLYGNQYEEKEEHLLLSMFQKVLQEEFKEATSIGSLLRANTALTRMMTTYTRRGPGQQYLKQSLIKPLQNITNERDMNLEVNPSTVYEAYINDYETKTGKPSPLKRKVSPEECAQNPQVKEIIAPRIEKLISLGDAFLDSIIGSLDSVPYGIRWICKQIKELVEKKFAPNVTQSQTCGLIGGFFLLRYINPAIVTPTAFMLVENILPNSKKNLTYPAKMLQNLANNVMFGGVKEFFMEPLNVFLNKNRDRLNDFLEKLTKVENLDENLNMDQYVALGKSTETNITITLNEMYFVHSLLEQHINVLAPNPDDPLRLILSDLGPAAPQLSRAENANVELKLINRFADQQAESSNPDQIYTETKHLLFNVLREMATYNKQVPQSQQITSFAAMFQVAANAKNLELQDNLKKIVVNMKILIQKHNYAHNDQDMIGKMKKDLVNEFFNFDAHIQKSNSDLEKLKQVLAAIQEHNVFLQQQIKVYEEYLNNVKASYDTADSSKKKDKKKDKKDKDSKTTTTTTSGSSSPKSSKKGPFKFAYSQLEKDGMIIESEVPNDKRSMIFFNFTSEQPGIFDVVLMYRNVSVTEIRLQLDELLEMQSVGKVEYETDFIKLNVNLLIFLLNKTFVTGDNPVDKKK
ncbi:RasGTPase-activating protein [Tieghemostelium lacteum]|uniref:RasGTPase-activating protein n=1 Tax=Tieghemostelium lacteum TaxID=361077 RepID=A0A151ZAU2_TIELA|nr:RasGTPase-activating protein [Tieghemostelium lacteum]|eukprot:KYQ91046.1 RasGTPase-activating protein [Tieghemostelium lacteum]